MSEIRETLKQLAPPALRRLLRLFGLSAHKHATARALLNALVPAKPRGPGRRILLGEWFPELVAEWHPTKNRPLGPLDVTHGSNRKVWWRCSVDPSHEWLAKVTLRTVNGSGCPMCFGLVVTPARSLRACFPAVAAEWHPIKNGSLTPDDVTAHSNRQAWWRCSKCRRVWQAHVCSRTAGTGCPACTGHIVTSKNSLQARRPRVAAEWHPTKNGALTPRDVMGGSRRRVWWRCAVDSTHEWSTSIASRTSARCGCPFCARVISTPATSLQVTDPALAAEWHLEKNGDLKPTDVLRGTERKVWWRCPKDPSHVWQATIGSRANGTGCPACSGLVATPTTSLRAKRPNLAAYWHPTKNGELSPDTVTPGSKRDAWWRCAADHSHEWRLGIERQTRRRAPCKICGRRGTRESRGARVPATMSAGRLGQVRQGT